MQIVLFETCIQSSLLKEVQDCEADVTCARKSMYKHYYVVYCHFSVAIVRCRSLTTKLLPASFSLRAERHYSLL